MKFEAVMVDAVAGSISSAGDDFRAIARALQADVPNGPGQVLIRDLAVDSYYSQSGMAISNVGQATEYALRRRVGDKRLGPGGDLKPIEKKLEPDVMLDVNGKVVEIEVATSRDRHDRLKVDSRGLAPRDDKWYLYVDGPIQPYSPPRPIDYRAWLVRADALAAAYGQTVKRARRSISPGDPDAVSKIEDEIRDITNHLAREILRKAGGEVTDAAAGAMAQKTLGSLVGPNTVRFDVKFGPAMSESLLRDLVRESLSGE